MSAFFSAAVKDRTSPEFRNGPRGDDSRVSSSGKAKGEALIFARPAFHYTELDERRGPPLAEQVLRARRPAHGNFDTSVLLVGHVVTGRHGRTRFSVGSGGDRGCRNACGDQGRRNGIGTLPRQRLVEGWRTRGIRVAK